MKGICTLCLARHLLFYGGLRRNRVAPDTKLVLFTNQQKFGDVSCTQTPKSLSSHIVHVTKCCPEQKSSARKGVPMYGQLHVAKTCFHKNVLAFNFFETNGFTGKGQLNKKSQEHMVTLFLAATAETKHCAVTVVAFDSLSQKQQRSTMRTSRLHGNTTLIHSLFQFHVRNGSFHFLQIEWQVPPHHHQYFALMDASTSHSHDLYTKMYLQMTLQTNQTT